jgi:excisionase family DNA binding protein
MHLTDLSATLAGMARRVAVQQLSLPGLEPDKDDSSARNPQAAALTATKPASERSVVPSRPLSQPVQAEHPLQSLLTTKEAAQLLRVHPRTVQRLVERGQLTVVQLGAAVRFDPIDVAGLTARLKRREGAPTTSTVEVIRPARGGRVSFSDRLRSHRDEHRTS